MSINKSKNSTTVELSDGALDSVMGAGPLDAAKAAFSHQTTSVKAHTGGAASKAAENMGANANTTGNSTGSNTNTSSSSTTEHEVTHTVNNSK